MFLELAVQRCRLGQIEVVCFLDETFPSKSSAAALADQVFDQRLFFPIGSDDEVLASALGASQQEAERGHLCTIGEIVDRDYRLMPAGMVEAMDGKPAHSQLAHISEGHWREGAWSSFPCAR
jgi:hypothetical protein